MSPRDAQDIMLTVFRDAWISAGLDIGRVRWDDKAGTVPSDDAPWARVTIRHAESPARAFGADGVLYENSGTLYVQVFTPAGNGNSDSYDLAFHVVKAFRAARNEGVWFRNARLKEVGNSGAFEQTNVLTDFTYDN